MQCAEPRRVLIVEDNLIVAEHMAAVIEDAGFTALGPVTTNDEAEAFLDNPANTIDAVLLDLQLDYGPSLMIANRLLSAGIPFVFATGNRHQIPPEYREHPVCEKPFGPQRLVEVLIDLLKTGDMD